MNRTRRALALPVAVLAAAALALSACSDAEDNTGTAPVATPQHSGSHATGEHSKADVDFATMLFANRLQTVQLVGLAKAKATSAELKAAAGQVQEQQSAQIAKLGGWLDGWGTQAANIKPADHAGMAGVVAQSEFDKLAAVNGPTFDTAWTALMIKSLRESSAAAQAEIKNGASEEAKAEANTIVATQAKQIATLSALLGKLG